MHYTSEYWSDVERVLSQIPNLKKIYGKSILITGGTGMVCSSIVELLLFLNKRYNAEVKIILAGRNKEKMEERFSPFILNHDFSYIRYDATSYLFDPAQPINFIIDGASPASPSHYDKIPVETMLANLLGINSLLNVAKENKNTRILYISSSEVYGEKVDNQPYKEDDYGFVDILNPRACYPDAKRAAETLCASYKKEYNVDFVIVRPGHIYGPSILPTDSRASAQFTRDAASGHDIVMKSAGSQLRSYCYTLDCASAILTVLLDGVSGEAYNISNPDSVITIREIAELFAKAGNVNVVFENPSGKEKKSYNLMSNSSLDATKLLSLGWKSVFPPLDGVTKTLKFIG